MTEERSHVYCMNKELGRFLWTSSRFTNFLTDEDVLQHHRTLDYYMTVLENRIRELDVEIGSRMNVLPPQFR